MFYVEHTNESLEIFVKYPWPQYIHQFIGNATKHDILSPSEELTARIRINADMKISWRHEKLFLELIWTWAFSNTGAPLIKCITSVGHYSMNKIWHELGAVKIKPNLVCCRKILSVGVRGYILIAYFSTVV